MGLIASLFSKKVEAVFVDFESAQPLEGEQKLYDELRVLLEKGDAVIREIQDYKGAQDLVRKAMGNATRENEEAAFNELLHCVRSIKLFFDFSHEIEKVIPPLLRALSEPSDPKPHSLAAKPALGRQLAHLLNFGILFDQIRMMRPHLSNDFSYYRRLLPKFHKHPQVEVKEDDANAMTLFTAEPLPMIVALGRASQQATQQFDRSPVALAVMSNSCLIMIKERKYDNVNTNLLCARAMTAAFVLFDRVTPLGGFYRNSPIDIKGIVTTLQSDFAEHQALQNSIRFSTKHFNDESTPAAVQNLFP